MTCRKIYYAHDPRLRQIAQPVTDFGPSLQTLADDMLETMRHARGVGLAGPQIGVMARIFVAELPVAADAPPEEGDRQSGQPFVIVNPKIVTRSAEMTVGQEGCLSIPTWYGMVPRHERIEIEAQDVAGRPLRMAAEGFLARIFQHETDHLDGILFIDRLEAGEKLWQVIPQVDQPPAETDGMTVSEPAGQQAG